MWWGRRDPAKDALPTGTFATIRKLVSDEAALQARSVSYSMRSLYIQGLPKGVFDLEVCQALEYTLTEVFSEYVPEDVAVVPGKGYGFIRVSLMYCFFIVHKDLFGVFVYFVFGFMLLSYLVLCSVTHRIVCKQ